MSTDIVTTEKPKVPMGQAATMLAQLCDRIDDGEELDAVMVSVFNETRLDLAAAVDRRIAFHTWIAGAVEAARSARDEWNDKVQQLKAIHERFKYNTKVIIEANPDLPYQGSLGKLAIQKNPVALDYTFGDKNLTPQTIDMFAIDPKYILVETTYRLNTPLVKDDLKAGAKLPWAELTQGTSVRFRK